MIKNLEDSDIKIIELGQGTTYVSQVMVDGDNISSGIAFSNHSDGKIHGDEIIIEITDFKGFASYMRSGLELLKTWKLEGSEDDIEELLNTLKPLMEFDNKLKEQKQ